MPEAGKQNGTTRQPVAFISHHSSQVDQARHIARILDRNGIKGWMAPDDIEPGQAFDQVIIEQIGQCDVILLLFSARSDQSKHVKREVMLAEQHNKLIYPIRLESIQPDGLAYWLQDYQWIDWLDGRDEAIERMVATIRRQLSLPEADAPALVTPEPPVAPPVQHEPQPAAAAPAIPPAQTNSADAPAQRRGSGNTGMWYAVLGGLGVLCLAALVAFAMGWESSRNDKDLLGELEAESGDGDDFADSLTDADNYAANPSASGIRPGNWQVRYSLTGYSSDLPGTSEQLARATVERNSGTACISSAQASDIGRTVMVAFTSQLPDCQIDTDGTGSGIIGVETLCRDPSAGMLSEIAADGTYTPDSVNVEYDMTQWFEAIGAGQSIDSTISMTSRRIGGC